MIYGNAIVRSPVISQGITPAYNTNLRISFSSTNKYFIPCFIPNIALSLMHFSFFIFIKLSKKAVIQKPIIEKIIILFMENVLYITPPRIGANIAETDDICAISVLVLFKSSVISGTAA